MSGEWSYTTNKTLIPIGTEHVIDPTAIEYIESTADRKGTEIWTVARCYYVDLPLKVILAEIKRGMEAMR